MESIPLELVGIGGFGQKINKLIPFTPAYLKNHYLIKYLRQF